MNVLRVRRSGGEALALSVAERYTHRLLGLAGMRALPPRAGLLIPNCRSVHTFGMRFPIDVLFVTIDDRTLHVHDARRAVPPCRLVRASRTARARPGIAALELPPGFGLCKPWRTRLEP
jgi:uncharacterized protein